MEKAELYKIIMSEFRCSNCNKQIFKGKLRSDYHIEAFCPRCKNITIFERSSIAQEKNNVIIKLEYQENTKNRFRKVYFWCFLFWLLLRKSKEFAERRKIGGII